MATKVVFKTNLTVVQRQMEANIDRALDAVGTKAVNLILWQMRQGYGKPIRKTGDLQRDLSYQVDVPNKRVVVGNTLDYAIHVHEGTSKMKGRPYIKDGLSGDNHTKQIAKVASEYLKQGFDK